MSSAIVPAVLALDAYVINPEREACEDVISRMEEWLSPDQTRRLRDVLEDVFNPSGSDGSNADMLGSFLAAKEIEGLMPEDEGDGRDA